MGYEKTVWKNGDLITADKMNHAEDGIYQANESIHRLKIKQTARLVIATSTAGWTQEDCDYLCDGIDDQIDINKAIQELPEWGGEIKILDGIYHINSSIELNKPNTKLSGNGFSTTIQADGIILPKTNMPMEAANEIVAMGEDGYKKWLEQQAAQNPENPAAENEKLKQQLTDTQLALVEAYEMMLPS